MCSMFGCICSTYPCHWCSAVLHQGAYNQGFVIGSLITSGEDSGEVCWPKLKNFIQVPGTCSLSVELHTFVSRKMHHPVASDQFGEWFCKAWHFNFYRCQLCILWVPYKTVGSMMAVYALLLHWFSKESWHANPGACIQVLIITEGKKSSTLSGRQNGNIPINCLAQSSKSWLSDMCCPEETLLFV